MARWLSLCSACSSSKARTPRSPRELARRIEAHGCTAWPLSFARDGASSPSRRSTRARTCVAKDGHNRDARSILASPAQPDAAVCGARAQVENRPATCRAPPPGRAHASVRHNVTCAPSRRVPPGRTCSGSRTRSDTEVNDIHEVLEHALADGKKKEELLRKIK